MSHTTMNAIRYHQFGGPDVLQLERIAIPEPQAGEVLVRIHTAGVLPIDWKIRLGKFPLPIQFPYIPGTAFAGVVEKTGPGVTEFRTGQAVFGRSANGTYAEYTTTPVESVAHKPQSVSFEEAAAISGGATTAWQALIHESGVKAGDRVLILGAAGGVGAFAVQFAKWKGAYVIGTASTANLDFVRSLGADMAVDYTATPVEEVVQDADILLDAVGGKTLESALPAVKKGGTLITLTGPPPLEKLHESGIKALKLGRLVTSHDLAEIAGLMEAGQVKATISAAFSLQDARLAHELSQRGHGRGRIVLRMAD